MIVLLDTHVFLWWNNEPHKLSQRHRSLLLDKLNILMLSVASIWEIQIKLQTGKLRLSTPLAKIIEWQTTTNGMQILPVQLEHVLTLGSLPDYHKDPFDRLLIAQAITGGLSIATDDPVIARYPVNVLA